MKLAGGANGWRKGKLGSTIATSANPNIPDEAGFPDTRTLRSLAFGLSWVLYRATRGCSDAVTTETAERTGMVAGPAGTAKA